MNICVFLASKYGKDPKYTEATAQVGRTMAQRGHGLVFGGSNSGLMKVLCDSFLAVSDNVLGVEPDTPYIRQKVHPGIKNVVYTESMSARKDLMIKSADAFIVMPGGAGTLDEAGDVLQQNKVANIQKPVVFVNVNGFYDPLKQLLANMEAEDMLGLHEGTVLFSDDIEEIFAFIEGYAERNAGKKHEAQ